MAYLPALPPVVFHVVFLVGPFSGRWGFPTRFVVARSRR